MKTPVCFFCAKTGILCAKCQEKLNSGDITQEDVEMSKLLIEREGKYQQLKDCILHRTVSEGNLVVALVSCPSSRGVANTFWLSKLSRELSQALGKTVKVVEKTSNLKKLLEQIVHPARVIGTSIIWLPDGTSEVTLRIPRSDMRYAPADLQILEKIVRRISGERVHVVVI